MYRTRFSTKHFLFDSDSVNKLGLNAEGDAVLWNTDVTVQKYSEPTPLSFDGEISRC